MGQVVTIRRYDRTEQNTLVFDNEDILHIIRQNCGEELGAIVADKLDTSSADEIYAREMLNTDLDNYEASLADKDLGLLTIEEEANELLYYLTSAKRIDKNKIYQELKSIRDTAILYR